MRLEDIAIPEGPEVVQREIEYKGGTVSCCFRIVDAAKAQSLFDYMDAKGERDMKKVRSADFRIIAAVCCKEDGSDLYTDDQARKLPAPLKVLLAKHAIEVNVPQDEGTPKN
jgi:hypothetical protein